jgi:K+-sensing histidine kinase KdpD
LAAAGGEVGDASAIANAVRLAERADARLTVLVGDGVEQVQGVETRRLVGTLDEAISREAERDPVDLVVLSPPPDEAPSVVARAMRASERHVLVVREGKAPIERALLCVAGGEQGKVDVLFAGRLLRHIGAEVTVMIVVAGDEPDPVVSAQAERFVAAGVKTLASAGIKATTALRHGDPTECIEEEAASGVYGLIVVGSPPLRADTSAPIEGLVGRLLSSPIAPSVLVVRSVP